MRYTCILVDDETKAVSAIKKDIEHLCPELDVVGVAHDVEDSIQLINSKKPDLLFLDLRLITGTGFEVLQQLSKPLPQVVFTTAYGEYALKAIKFNALDYLLKPIDPHELRLAVSKFIERVKDNVILEERILNLLENQHLEIADQKLPVSTSKGISFVKVHDIIRVQADGNYSKVFLMKGNKLHVSKTLKEFSALLSAKNFFRVHSSHLINMAHITNYYNKDGGYLEMDNKDIVPLAQRKKSEFLSKVNFNG